MQLRKALDAYLLQLRADGRSEHTIGQYRRHLLALDRWLAEAGRPRRLASIDHETLAAFLASDAARCRPDGQPKRATSANTLRTSLRTFWAYAHAAGMVSVNPARLIRRARCAPPPPRALSPDEVRRLLKAVDAGEGEAARRDGALVRLLLNTGLRLSSALALTTADVDLARSELHVRKAKGDVPIRLPLSRVAVRDLRAHLRRLPAGHLFAGEHGPLTRRQAARRISLAAERAGLRGRASAHVMRHVFGCRLLKATGGNLPLVQQALAHRSITSTTTYARVEVGALRAALRACRD